MKTLALVCLLALIKIPSLLAQTPLLLTYTEDPSTSITAVWLTHTPQTPPLLWREEKTETWNTATGKSEAFPHSSHTLHQAHLRSLKPNTPYEIQIEAQSYRFQTLPQTLQEPLTFLSGGDMMETPELMETTNRFAAQLNPSFIVVGGDLAYDNGEPTNAWRWETWLHSTSTTLRRPNGQLIPILACVGNHETPHGFLHQSPQKENPAPYFHTVFGNKPFQKIQFGDYLSLILLDSGHTTPIGGKQTKWLKQTLSTKPQTLYTLCVYHVPAYPSVRNPFQLISKEIRKNWVPTFEKNRVDLCLENHDHAYKKTFPLLQSKPHPKGITYIGDGCWGTTPREPNTKDYLKTTQAKIHLLKITLQKDKLSLEALTPQGETIDRYSAPPKKDPP